MSQLSYNNHLSFNSHVASVTKSCNYHIRSFRHIRSCLTDDMAKSVAVALVSSKLDYANSLLYGTSLHSLTWSNYSAYKTILLNWYFKLQPFPHMSPSKPSTGFQLNAALTLKYLSSLTDCSILMFLPIFLLSYMNTIQPEVSALVTLTSL